MNQPAFNPMRSPLPFVALLFAASALLPSLGCSINFLGVLGSGTQESESRDVDTFDRMLVAGAATVHVRFGDTPALTITTDDNLLELIETKVVDGRLEIEMRQPLRPKTGLTIDVTTPDLNSLEISGATTVEIHDAKLDTLSVSTSGATEFIANGTVDSLEITSSGAAELDAAHLQAKSVSLKFSGAVSGSVYASDSLSASISGAGALTYYGNPENVSDSLSGAGRIAPGDDSDLE